MDYDFGHRGPRPMDREEGAGEKAKLRDFFSLIVAAEPKLGLLGVALSVNLLSTLAGLLVPLFAKGIVDGLSRSALDPGKALLIGGAFVLQAGGSALSGYLLSVFGQDLVSKLRERLWRKQLSLKVAVFDKRGSGEMVSRMANDAQAVKSFITDNLPTFASGAVGAAGALAFLFSIDWRMSLFILGALPVAAAALYPLGKLMRSVAFKTMEENASLVSTLSRALSEIRLVKASGAEEAEYERGRERIGELYAVGVKEGTASALVAPIMSIILMALLVVIVGYGGARVASGAISAGALVAFTLYLIQVVMPVTMLAQGINQLQKARGATKRMSELLGEEEERAAGEEPGDGAGELRFDDVGFAYGEGKVVLDGLSFSLESGSVVALVGPSGAGKTTVFSLIEGFYEPQRGRILYGGRELGELSLPSWRRKIGYVLQDSPLLAGTVRDNLAYGMEEEPDKAAMEEALRMANAMDFVSELPGGLEAEVGERGIKLSGGQRQRLSLARAFLRDPEILMLDEATSSLDSESEAKVQDAMGRLMEGRTCLVIAHRLSTVVDADRILVVDGGRIVGAGTHEELVRDNELYRNFAERQFRYDLAGKVEA